MKNTPSNMKLMIFNCRRDELTRERLGFHSALERCGDVIVCPVRRVTPTHVEMAVGSSVPISEVEALWHLDPPETLIPEGLPSANLLTLWVHLDAGTTVPWRALWSRLFHIACLSGWDGTGYKPRGAYRIVARPYAARREWFTDESCPRDFDIGWVGTIQGPIYTTRRRLLPLLAARYRMNDWHRSVPESNLLPIYRRSKIVVNIQRDDCPALYNIRCFEAFAAGALVCMKKPNRIEDAGFKDGVHYIGYRSDAELFALLDYLLANEAARTSIARAGRELAMRRHTYDQRVAELLQVIGEERRRNALARRLSAAERSYIYCHYYNKLLHLHPAWPHLKKLVSSVSPLALLALAHSLRAAWHGWCLLPASDSFREISQALHAHDNGQ
jgi:hypothetical protein